MRALTFFALGCIAASSIAGSALAQDPKARSEDEKAIRAAERAYVEALRTGDAKARAAAWTADGDYIDAAGQHYKARDLFAVPGDAPAADGGAGAKSSPESVTVTSLRFIAPDVAIADGAADLPGGQAVRYTVVWVKQEGRWKIDSLREAAASAADDVALDGLAWLVGNWVSQGEGPMLRVSYAWSDNHKFILGRYSVLSADGVEMTASQRIGWDPASRRLKSWFFDSAGGFGEGQWSADGKRWTVRSTQTLPDGTQVDSTATYMLASDDEFTWTATNGADGAERKVTFKRVPASE